jgi:hypothetical protein
MSILGYYIQSSGNFIVFSVVSSGHRRFEVTGKKISVDSHTEPIATVNGN